MLLFFCLLLEFMVLLCQFRSLPLRDVLLTFSEENLFRYPTLLPSVSHFNGIQF